MLLGVWAVMVSLLVSCTDLINLSHGLDDPYEGMRPTLVRAGSEQDGVNNTVQISVSLQTPPIDSLWGIGWETEWQYSWNENLSDYGILGYSAPELIKGTIYSVDRNTQKRNNPFYKIFDPDGGRLSLSTGYVYDILFYNYGTEYTLFNQSDDKGTYTAYTRESYMGDGSYNQPDELSGAMVTGIELSNDPSDYQEEYDDDNNVVYVKNLDVVIQPYTYIYLCQVVILNNADQNGNRIITGAKGISVTGVAQSVDMFSRKTSEPPVSITTDDIKPMQNHTDVRLEDSVVDNADILAARMVTFGLPQTEVPEKNNMVIVLTLRNGNTCKITCDITEQMHLKPTGGVIAVCIDANDIPKGYLATYEYVDLGLSVKWATFNVGATRPEEYGDYFAWGETEPKTNYDWSTYKYCNGSENALTKYCSKSDCGYNGYTDTKTTLDPDDDVAQIKWGGNWRMPTNPEIIELRYNCDWEWITQNGVNGWKVTSKKDSSRSIFLPAAGFRSDTSVKYAGLYGLYSSSYLSEEFPNDATDFFFRSVEAGWVHYRRSCGRSVRPVCP